MHAKEKKESFFERILKHIEYIGNKLPDPIALFFMLAGLILVFSFIGSFFNLSAKHPGTGEVIVAENLLNEAGIVYIITEMLNNFTEFPALGMVLVIMIGVGLAEKSGFFETLMKKSILVTPKKAVIPVIVLIAILGNISGDAAMVVLPPIAAIVLMAFGFHPLVGLVAAYASTTGALSANLILGMTDVLAAGFTEIGAQTIEPDFKANASINYYFIIVSTFILLPVATWVTYKFTIPRFGEYEGEREETDHITADEVAGLKWAGIATGIFSLIILVLLIPKNGLLRNPETGSIVEDSPLMDGIIPILTVFFLIPGLFYGIRSKTIKNTRDFGEMVGESMGAMGPYIVLVFAAAQMLAYFDKSNLGPIVAIKGAGLLERAGMTGVSLIVIFILFSSLLNVLIGSAAAKWALLAPIFVPMFMLLGYHPGFTQALYRVGDSISNPITPMLPTLVLLLSFAKKYDRKMGLGTLISALFPYTFFFGIFWIMLIVVWYFLGLPVGPGAPVHL